jgi:hypothetical protein
MPELDEVEMQNPHVFSAVSGAKSTERERKKPNAEWKENCQCRQMTKEEKRRFNCDHGKLLPSCKLF